MKYDKSKVEIKISKTLNEHIINKSLKEDVQAVDSPANAAALQDRETIKDNLEKDFKDQKKATKEFVKETADIDLKESRGFFVGRKKSLNESISNKELHKACYEAQYNIGLILTNFSAMDNDSNYSKSIIADVDIETLGKAYDILSDMELRFGQVFEEAVEVEEVMIDNTPVSKIKAIRIEGEDVYKVVDIDVENELFKVLDSDGEESEFDFDFVRSGVDDGEMQVMKIFRTQRGERNQDDELLIHQIDKDNSVDMTWLKVYDTLSQGLYKGNPNNPNNDWIGVDIGKRVKRYDRVLNTPDGDIEVWDKTEKGLQSAIDVANYLGLEYVGPKKISYMPDEYDWRLIIKIK